MTTRRTNTVQTRLFSAALLVAAVVSATSAPVEPIGSTPVDSSQSKLLQDAIAALDEGVPEVAIVKLQKQLADTVPLGGAERKLAKTKLAEALLAAGRADDALSQVHDPEVMAPMLEARIDAAAGRWKDALVIYEAVPAASEQPTGALSRAECLWQLGRKEDAIAALVKLGSKAPAIVHLRLAEFYLDQHQLPMCEKLLPTIRAHNTAERKWKQYVEALLYLAQGDAAYAYPRFEDIQRDPHNLTDNLIVGSVLGMTESRAILSGLNAADDILEQFIWKHPESPGLGTIFRKLDEVYSGETDPSRSELDKWSQRDPARRAAFANYYLAKEFVREGKEENARGLLNNFAERFPGHPIVPDALFMEGRLLANQGKFVIAQKALDAAMRVAPDDKMRAEIEMASATAHFQAGEFLLAATEFRNAGEQLPALWQRAISNSALCWLHQGNYSRFLEVYKELSEKFPDSPLRCELILEEGLFQASQSDPRAESTLQQFLRDFPTNLRVPEARLALAELRFAKNDAAGANAYLNVVNATPAPSQTVEQSDYLAIFVADSATPRDEAKVIALCETFLERYAASTEWASTHLADVRMKLGQVFFKREDFASAQTQFETLARETPGSPLVESGLFLAGQCSMKSMSAGGIDHAIELFEEVTKFNGPLKLHARLQQALAQNRLGKANEAVILYDVVLRDSPPPEVKFAALAGKANNLSEMGDKDKNGCEQALAIYEQLASAPDVNAIWRSQALYKKGRCLEVLSRPEDALASYYDVLQAGVAKPEEYLWFYKAGFDAGRLCEAQEQWKSAIGIYQKMAVLDGPRAEEAKARMKQLKLEHFIWE